MSEEGTLQVYYDPSLGDGAGAGARRLAAKNQAISLHSTDDLCAAATRLSQGEGDLMACSAEWAIANPTSGLTVVGTLARKEPTLIMVSDDKMEYLAKSAIIVAELELCRRQLLRARSDLEIHTPQSIAELSGIECPELNDKVALATWLEELRQRGEIDGFVISRSLFDAANIKSRRHTLGLQRGESSRQRFLPPPWQGFTLLMARHGFPLDIIIEDLDESAFLAFNLESKIMHGIDEYIRSFIGLYAGQRQIGTVLRELDADDDLHLRTELTDAYDKPLSTKPRVELMLEVLNRDGTVTVSVERIAPQDEAGEAVIRLLQTFTDLVEIATMEHLASPRLGEARPPMMSLED
ncbi:MAG TPA: hypothetical protein EYO42_04270 [Candidatus Poseidoniales archaeon]|nr:hypothetical protein [Candidatus Poseidoniales archaeon]